ncbi:MAG: SDR family oxidoreductase [Caulobacterales bacterium]|nr:SDR family oxidoreductase [Caulobacterales bacterium]
MVTGGGRGLGRAIAIGLARRGAKVMITGRTEENLRRTVEDIRADDGEADFARADVSSEDDLLRLREHVRSSFRTTDILVNNAGVNPYYKRPEHTSYREWTEIIDVNLTGVFLCSRIFGEDMIAQGGGSIISISSIAGRVGLPRTTAYCAAKGGVELMTRSLALDWAQYGVRINTVAPGYFESDLTRGLQKNEALSQSIVDKTPLGRIGQLSDFVGAVVFLASPASAYVTGQTIGVDGGWTAA